MQNLRDLGLPVAPLLVVRTGAHRFLAQQLVTLLAVATVHLPGNVRASDGIPPLPSNNTCHASGNPAIRPRSPIVNATIEFGLKRSPTLAAEFADIQASDMVVYIEAQRESMSDLHGYVAFISRTTLCRYVRVVLNGNLNLSQLASILGHELQHALEIAAHPEVVDNTSLIAMYERFGHHARRERSYDSAEAVEVGLRVAAELNGTVSVKSSPAETER